MATVVDDPVVEANQRRQHHKSAVTFLQSYRINGSNPFFSNPADTAHQLMQSVHGLSVVMQSALHDADEARRANQEIGQGVVELYPVYLAQAFEAIGSVTALACFFLEAPEA